MTALEVRCTRCRSSVSRANITPFYIGPSSYALCPACVIQVCRYLQPPPVHGKERK